MSKFAAPSDTQSSAPEKFHQNFRESIAEGIWFKLATGKRFDPNAIRYSTSVLDTSVTISYQLCSLVEYLQDEARLL